MYKDASMSALTGMYWGAFFIEASFAVIYYCLAGAAVYTGRPKYFEYFARCGVVGVFLEIALAYVNRFNLLIFFMRLLAFMYARVLKGFMVQLLLLPPAAQPTSENQDV